MNRRDFVKATTILSVSSATALGISGLAFVIEKSTGIENYVFQLQTDARLDNYVVRDAKLYRIEEGIRKPVSDPEIKDAIYQLYSRKFGNDVFFYRYGYSPPRPKPTELETRIKYVHVRDFVAK